MRDRFPGYYTPSADEFSALWTSALIVPDTNVLLALYRLPETTRGKLLEVLEKLKDRLFIPYQVGAEFQRNRLNVIDDQMATYAQVEKAINGFATSVGEGLREHPRLDRKDLEIHIAEALKPVQDHLEGLRKGHPDPLSGDDPLGGDVVRDALEPLLADHIGEPRDLASLSKEGSRRYAQKVPPGWGDSKKPEPDCYGDLAIWLDVIAKANAEKLPVILVTEERKPDWWLIRHGKVVGPQPQLIEEMHEEAGQSLWIYGLQRFMEEAAEALGLEFSEDEREDVVRAETAAATKSKVSGGYLSAFEPGGTIFTTNWDDSAQHFFPGGIPKTQVVWNAASRKAAFNAGLWPSEQTFQPGWSAMAEPDEESALLRVAWQPHLVGLQGEPRANQLACEVTNPNGDTANASRRDTTLSAAFRYPDNFVGAESAEPGSYSYLWRFSYANEESVEEIAAGEFKIPAAAT